MKVYLISEPYSPMATGYQDDRRPTVNWIKTKLRPLIYRTYGALLRRRLSGVFAISPLAAMQYRRVGIPDEKIFPFGYFVPQSRFESPVEFTDSTQNVSGLRLIFIGTLIARKGLDILIDAVMRMHADGKVIKLDEIGRAHV